MIALFAGHESIAQFLKQAEHGWLNLLVPTTVIADAEAQLHAGLGGWEAILLTRGVQSLPLTEHTAIETGSWPGDLPTRHAVHEAHALGAAVVTRNPAAYVGHQVSLRVV
jgi:hypothetical protein